MSERGPATGHAAAIADAVAELYRACRLQPPAVLVARDATHCGQIVARLMRRQQVGTVVLGFCLAVMAICTVQTIRGSEFASAYAAGLPVVLLPWFQALRRSDLGRFPTWGSILLQALLPALLGAAVYGIAHLVGLEHRDAWFAASTAIGSASCLQLAADLLAPVAARWQMLRSGGYPGGGVSCLLLSLRGAPSEEAVVLRRLASAFDDVGEGEAARPQLSELDRRHRGPVQRAVQEAIQDEIRQAGLVPFDTGLALGRSVGFFSDVPARVSGLAGAAVDPLQLPRILRAAVHLDDLAEAVCVLHGAAVVLPTGAPVALTVPPAPARISWRRSRRLPWHAALHWVSDDPDLALVLDLLPSERLAGWLLARRILRLPEAARRTPAIRALGPARFAAALRVRPMQEDASGRLYQVGRSEDPSVFVAVRDRVLGPDGQPLEHWISVPPHVATAQEAVAWSFGMTEAEYRPTRET